MALRPWWRRLAVERRRDCAREARAREKGASARGFEMVGAPTEREREGARRRVGWHTEEGGAEFLALGGQGGVCRPVFYYVYCKHQCYDTPA